MSRFTRVMLVVAMTAGSLGLASPVFAQDPIHKAGRGLANLLTGVLEIPKGIHQGAQEDNPLIGAGIGLFKGAWLAATRIVVGAYEAVTFPLPYPKDYASPYEGLELPDYVWQ